MKLMDILRVKGTSVHCIAPQAKLCDVIHQLCEYNIGSLVVREDMGGRPGRVLGIITERDIVRGLKSNGPDLLSKSVRDLMTAKVLTCAPHDRAVDIMALMMSRHVHHVPVLTTGSLVGMVTVRDLLQLHFEEALAEAEAMQKYISGSE